MARVKFVIANRFDGLGGRLITLLLSLGLAEQIGARCLLHWPNTWDLSGRSLPWLFGGPLLEPFLSETTGHRIAGLDLLRHDGLTALRLIGHQDQLEADDLERFDAICLRSASPAAIATLPGFDVAAVKRACADQFRRLPLHPAVAERIARYPHLSELAGAIGVQVRRGDLLRHQSAVHRTRMIDLERYFSALERHGERAIFLASDSPAVVRQFRRHFGPRLLTLPRHWWVGYSRNGRRDLQQALCELLLLARCPHIVAGPSNFPRAAALIGQSHYELLPPATTSAEWERVRGYWEL